ncbi:MAG: hypothetical protein MUO24_00220 [Desulfobacterales bacterium]|nr:hypothetical protein [Desulfobacterales bacterium]
MKKIFLTLLILAGLMVVAIVGYAFFSWTQGKGEVQHYCSQLSEGTSIDAAKGMALKRGLRFYSSQTPDSKGEYSALVTRSGVMGRYVCIVEHNGRTVTKARLRFND